MFNCKQLIKSKNIALNLSRLVSCRSSSGNDIIEKWERKFEKENISEAEVSIQHILNHVVGKNVKNNELLLNEVQLKEFEKLCEARLARMPIQYIVGEWDFCDIKLKVWPPVFIPRPETEELVELILQQCDDQLTMRYLEVGSGTGAISLALLHSLPKAQCIALDQSEYACNLTRENAKSLSLLNRLKIFKHKLTDESELEEIEGKLDLIVSNPPYVPTRDLKTLQDEIKLFEDLRALDGGSDGLDIIKSILKFSSKRLRLQGHLWLEVNAQNPSHSELIQAYLNEHKSSLNLQFIACYRDMFDKERFVEIMKI